MPMTNRQEAIITGLLLGDGHLEKNGRYVRLKVDQALKHSDYVNWLYNELKNLVPARPVIIEENDKRTRKLYRRLHFATYSNAELKKWRDAFYVNRRKVIPSKIRSILKSKISLAIWLMDDGYKRNDCAAIRLNTDAFKFSEQQGLIKCLQKNFKIKSHLHKKGKWFNIYIPKGEAKEFSRLVEPYILPSFRHKLL
jgi:hypothetical protein